MKKQYDFEQYYPTPDALIFKMLLKVKEHPRYVLDPSAGKGTILESVKKRYYRTSVRSIEINDERQHILRSKGFNVIDSDFLKYEGGDKFDLIIANPPFNNGHLHLLKAIEIMYNGEIVFILNAATIKNPNHKIELELHKKLKELNANIEYIESSFENAERKTKVEIALIHIKIENKIEEDVFDKMKTSEEYKVEDEELKNVAMNDKILAKVREYELTSEKGKKIILDYYSVSEYLKDTIELSIGKDNCEIDHLSLTKSVQGKINIFLEVLRKKYWEDTLSLDEIKDRMTSVNKVKFYDEIEKYSFMEYSESNIRQFIINLISGFNKSVNSAIVSLFDEITNAAYHDNLNNENIQFFNGWKTNHAFKVKEKFVLQMYGSYEGAFIDSYSGKWKLAYSVKEKLDDIELAMDYLSGHNFKKVITPTIVEAFSKSISRKIDVPHFIIDIYKKGTIHFKFKDNDTLRRFNIIACKEKGWLPFDYNDKKYDRMNTEEQEIVNQFEGHKSYRDNSGNKLTGNSIDLKLLEYRE